MSILNWKNKVLGYTAQMGGGGSSGGGGQTTQQANQYSGISPWAQPFVSSLLGAGQQQIFDTKNIKGTAAVPAQYVDAQGRPVSADVVRNSVTGFDENGNPQTGVGSQYTLVPGTGTSGTSDSTEITGIHPYTAYGYNGAGMSAADQAAAQAAVAGFTPLQQQAYQGAANLQLPGQFGTASNLAGTAGYGALGTTGQAGMYGQQGSAAAQQAANLSNIYGGFGAQTGTQAGQQAGMYGQQGAQAGQQNAGLSDIYGGMGTQIGQQSAGQLTNLGQGALNQGQQGAAIGQQLGQMSTNPNSVQSYMNPYIQASLQPQLNLLAQQTGIQGAQQQSAATQAGAFGGSRSALQNALVQQSGNLAAQQAIGQGYNTAYQQAMNQMNASNQAALAGNVQAQTGYGQGLTAAQQAGQMGLAGTAQGLQGAQQAGQLGISGAQTGLSGAQAQGALGMQGYGMGLTGAGQAGNLGIAGANVGLSGVGAQQAGYGLAGSQGANLANIGTGQLAAQQGILGTQNAYGGQQQQQAQNIINAGMTNYQTAQQYPMTQLQQLSALAAPYVTKDVTTTQQQAQPSTATQLAGLGTAGVAGLALANKAAKGGLMNIKKMAGGGIASLNTKALLNPSSMSAQTLDRSTKDGAISPQVSGIAKAIQLNDQVNAKNASAMSQQAPQGTIMDELQAKADQMDQAEMIPKAIAVLKHKMESAIQEGDIPLAKKYAAELQQLTEMAQQQAPSAPAPEGIQQVAPQAGQMAQTEQPQGIDTAPSNLPEQTMAQGGIATFSSRGYVDEDEYQSPEEKDDAELQQLFGTGSDNDLIQAIAARGKQSEMHPSAGIQVKTEVKDGIKDLDQARKYNVGNLRPSGFSYPGQIGVSKGGFAMFDSPESGEAALRHDIGIKLNRGLNTPEKFVAVYAPASDKNDTKAYAKTIHSILGTKPGDTIPNTLKGIELMASAIKKQEGSQYATRNFAQGGIARYNGNLGPSLVVDDFGNVATSRAGTPLEGISQTTLDEFGNPAKTPKATVSPYNRPSIEDLIKSKPMPSGPQNPFPQTAAATEEGILSRGISAIRPYAGRALGALGLATYSPDLNSGERDEIAKIHSAQAFRSVSPKEWDSFDKASKDFVADKIEQAKEEVKNKQANEEVKNKQKTENKDFNNFTNNINKSDLSYTESKPDIYSELMADIKSRREESKKNHETNNLLALMQAGLGVAASKNIHPLGAIGEGGMQGLGALAQSRKEEAAEAKDIAAQQLGLYKYQTAAESAAANLAETKRGHDLAYGSKDTALDLRNQALFEKAYENQAKSIDARAAAALKSLGVEVLPEELQKQFDAQKQQAYKQLRFSYNLPEEPSIEYTPVRSAIPTIKPTIRQRLPESMGGLSKADLDDIEWANKNPYSPKAQEIKKRYDNLGVSGSSISTDRRQELNKKYDIN